MAHGSLKGTSLRTFATAYRMEIETVLNYLANILNLDGVRAEVIKKSLAKSCYVDDKLVRPQ
jgi:hypothetical protein